MKLFALALLATILVSACGVAIQERPAATASPTAPSSPSSLPTPSPLPTTSPPQTPSPFTPSGEMTPAPPTGYFIEALPKEVCYGETVVLRAKLGKDLTRLVYWEKQGNETGKIPPLHYEHILLTELAIQKDQEITYAFKVSEMMEDIRTKRAMTISPGIYSLYLISSGGDMSGAGSVTVSPCP